MAGGWSPFGVAIAGGIGIVYLLGLAGLVLLVTTNLPIGPDRREVIVAVTIAGDEVLLPGVTAKAADVADLEALLQRTGAALDWAGSNSLSVPAFFLDKLPANMSEIRSTSQRKRLFIGALLPLVLAVDNRIEQVRKRLTVLRNRIQVGRDLSTEDSLWLARTANAFGTGPDEITRLIGRVDAVSVPIVLAQAAIESGWGTSRFAREGNALFGQWTWKGNEGLVPAAREARNNHSVRRFPRLVDSVIAHIHNLNTHAAYAGFRRARLTAQSCGGATGGLMRMIAALELYSVRGNAYVKEIRTVIRQNRLEQLSDAHLIEPTQRMTVRGAS